MSSSAMVYMLNTLIRPSFTWCIPPKAYLQNQSMIKSNSKLDSYIVIINDYIFVLVVLHSIVSVLFGNVKR